MKILIIATPRSGSTVLTKTLSSVYGIVPFFEPFLSNYIGKPYNSLLENHIIKTMISEINIDTFNIEKYTHVLYLTRKNTLESSQSYDYQMEVNRENPKHWHVPYVLPLSKEPTKSFERFNEEFDIISKRGENVVYYEDLYCGDKETVYNVLVKNNLGDKSKEIYELLNKTKKYRMEKRTLI